VADTIEQLDIQISASAERSAKAVSKLTGVLQRLKTATTGLKGAASSVASGLSHITSSFTSSTKETKKLAAELDKVDAKFQKLMDRQEKMDALGIKHDSRAWKSLQYDMEKTGKEWEILRDKLAASKQNNVSGIFKGMAASLGNAFKGAASSIQNFGKQIMRIARYRAIRALIQDMGKSFEYLYSWSSAFGTQYAGSMDRIASSTLYLRNSIAAMAAPLVNALAPAIDFLIDKIVTLINWLNHLFAILGGQATYTVAKKSSAAWKDAAKSAGGAANELKRTLLGFDEINKLQSQNSGGGGGGGAGLDAAAMFEERATSGLFAGFSDAIQKSLEGSFSRIALIVEGATAAIGAILLFSGHPMLGLGMLIPALSAGFTTVALNWEEMPKQVSKTATGIMLILGGSLLALGTILAFATSHKALGIGLMISGLSTMGSAVALNWESIVKTIEKVVGDIGGVIGAALFTIGAILAFSGHPAIGIAMMVANAGLLAGSIALNWDEIPDTITRVITAISAAVGLGEIAIGAMLAFGGHPALGIALIVSGLTATAASAINWGGIPDQVQRTILDILAIVGPAELALGAVLLFSGHFGLGLALVLSGLVTTASVVANWDSLSDKMKSIISNVTGIIGKASLMLGMLMIVCQQWGLGLGLILLGVAGLSVSAATNQDFDGLKNKITKIVSDCVGAISKGFLMLGILAIITGNWAIGLGLIAAGVIGLVATSGADWDSLKDVGLKAYAEVKAGWDAGGPLSITATIKTVQTYSDTASQMFSDPVGFLRETNSNTQKAGGVGGVLGAIWNSMNGGSSSSSVPSNTAGRGLGRDTVVTSSGIVYDQEQAAARRKALGGIFSGGIWHNLPSFAGGVAGLRGTLFWAGEAGPEIVGNANGRTEVLNKSQIASAMFAAVRSAMAPTEIGMREAINGSGDGYRPNGSGNGDATLIELLREQNALLQEIAEKEITTSGINYAQRRANRRAGTTIVPVGT